MNTIKNIVKLADTLDEHDLQMAIFALEDMALEKDLKSIEGLPEGWTTKKVKSYKNHNSLCRKYKANMFIIKDNTKFGIPICKECNGELKEEYDTNVQYCPKCD